MAVINDNGPEESWDTGTTYIIPSHQSMHLCGLFSANQHATVRPAHTEKKTPNLLPVCIPLGRRSHDFLWASWTITERANDM